jgi:myo-inositol-1(or 4)-monophosphatase
VASTRRPALTPLAALLGQVDAVAAKAAAVLVSMQADDLAVTRKDLRDVVTAADLASEAVVLEGLRAIAPEAAILSEEAGASGETAGERFIVDPLDGTVNYAGGLPWYSVTIACQQAGRTVLGVTHAPAAGLVARYAEGIVAEVNGAPAAVSRRASLADAIVSVALTSHFSGEEVARAAEIVRRLGNLTRGVRIIISGALEMSLVAAGKLDAFIGIKADIVSHAAALPLVRAAGGRVTTLSGTEARDEDLEKVMSNALIHEELLAALKGA